LVNSGFSLGYVALLFSSESSLADITLLSFSEFSLEGVALLSSFKLVDSSSLSCGSLI